MFDDLGLKQLICEPTHSFGNTLDLLLCSCPEMISSVLVLPKDMICSSDHFGIKFKIKFNSKRLKNKKRKIYNFKKTDFKAINNHLCRIQWDNMLHNCDLYSSVIGLYQKLQLNQISSPHGLIAN